MGRWGVVAAIFLLAALLGVASAGAAEVPAPGTYGDVMRWYRQAAEAGNAEAQFLLGVQYESGVRGPDLEKAAGWFFRAAGNGHLLAQVKLARFYLEGRGVERDPAAAARWFREAAGAGSGIAAFNLGLLHERGEGVAADAAAAAAWYEVAFRAGIAEAGVSLALLHFTGKGVARDGQAGLMWLEMARARGAEVRETFVETMAADLGPEARAEAERRAAEKLAAMENASVRAREAR